MTRRNKPSQTLIVVLISFLVAAFHTVLGAAEPVDQPIETLRQLADAAANGEIPAQLAAKTSKLQEFIDGKQSTLSAHTPANSASSPAPFYIVAKADTQSAVAVDCREVQRRFALTKQYWRELLCVTNAILDLASRPCPDLRCIQQLTIRAENLKHRIEATYPASFDEKTITLVRQWQLASLRPGQLWIRDPGHQLTVSQVRQAAISSAQFRASRWRDMNWFDPKDLPMTTVTVETDRIVMRDQLSITNYCLESIRHRLWMDLILTANQSGSHSANPSGEDSWQVDLILDF